MDRIFVSYRRADDPFGAGLIAAALRDRFGEDGVFLDTWVLNGRGDPEAGLVRGLDESAVVLALIGRRWEARLAARARTAEESGGPPDWVAWELGEAASRGLPVTPVFLRRSRMLGSGVPDDLAHALPREAGVAVRQESLRSDVDRLVDAVVARSSRVPPPRTATVPLGDDLDPGTVAVGVDAMLRHVVPVPQQRMGNRELLVGTCVAVLGHTEWLRHVSAGSSPAPSAAPRPSGDRPAPPPQGRHPPRRAGPLRRGGRRPARKPAGDRRGAGERLSGGRPHPAGHRGLNGCFRLRRCAADAGSGPTAPGAGRSPRRSHGSTML